MVEVNARNLKNLTAMDLVDILLQSSCDEGYFIVGRLLLRAIERCAQSQETIKVTASHDQMERANFVTPGYVYESVQKKGLWKEFSEEISRDLDNASSKTRNALMVVAVLIATVTFQAGVSPPGGFSKMIYQQFPMVLRHRLCITALGKQSWHLELVLANTKPVVKEPEGQEMAWNDI
ncbi:hypothetical protein Sjap_004630 [Stephania japonica]|uniref:PGG domain-containing protein n=1 Tax=Stephania japonica TaxID=461633 RepID=A0AAP0PHZ5_9MAGN